MPESSDSSVAATDKDRVLQLKSPFGDDVVATHVSGAERLSQLFHFDLSLQSAKGDLSADKILGSPVTILFHPPASDKPRVFHGYVTEFAQVGYGLRMHEYQATVRPWFWFLSRSADCRVYEDQTVEDIFRTVAKEHGFSDFRFNLSANPLKREYCVQYRETAFNFLSRLLEDEGIYYYFEHTDSKHTMVLVDKSTAHEAVPHYESVPYFPSSSNQARRERDHIWSWTWQAAVQSGKYATSDFDFLKPTGSLRAEVEKARGHAQAKHAIFDYPAELQQMSTGESKRVAGLRLDELQSSHWTARGQGNAAHLAPGARFKLADHPGGATFNIDYLIVGASYTLSSNAYETGDTGDADFGLSIEAIDLKQQFRPPRTTPKPLIQGAQTAIVISDSKDNPKNAEIPVDKHGRIRVKFHWDSKVKRSCWVRVAQVWSGQGWGAQFLPRTGQEVIVSFLEGDPDRPIITGSVYNGTHEPPYTLPDKATQSGIKSRSSKDGRAANFNEIRFEDESGKEEFYLHAEKDLKVNVENDGTWTVGLDNDQPAKSKKGAAKFVVGKTYHLDAGDEITLETGQSKMVMKKDGSITINCKTMLIDATDKIDFKANSAINAKSNKDVKIDGTVSVAVKGLQVSVEGTTKAEFKSSVQTKVEGTMVDVSANGIASLKGALVKIN
jgi:type VI secretion system secreted protein VgrG